jgi:hypothetical protein
MGYLSNVASTIYGPKHEVLSFITAHKLEGNKALEVFSPHLNWQQSLNNTLYFVLDMPSIKWYVENFAVRDWHELMIQTKGTNLHYEFVRTGQDQDDIDNFSDQRDDANPRVLKLVSQITINIPRSK